MVEIYTSVNFFRNFGANVLLGKNALKLENVYIRTIILANRSSSQDFYHVEVILYVKNYPYLKFCAILRW